MATSHPKKSVSSVQMGQSSATALLEPACPPDRVPQAASALRLRTPSSPTIGGERGREVRVDFEDTPNPQIQHSSNENVGIKYQGFPLRADYYDLCFFWRLARLREFRVADPDGN